MRKPSRNRAGRPSQRVWPLEPRAAGVSKVAATGSSEPRATGSCRAKAGDADALEQ